MLATSRSNFRPTAVVAKKDSKDYSRALIVFLFCHYDAVGDPPKV